MKLPSILVFLAMTLDAAVAHGYQERLNIWINGVRLTPGQIQTLASDNCGVVASGRYWLDFSSGIWGYEGGPAQGRLGDGCKGAQYHRGGPGGYIGSDGNTSYYYDPGAGCSVIPGEGVSC
jgi:hypothetical protein